MRLVWGPTLDEHILFSQCLFASLCPKRQWSSGQCEAVKFVKSCREERARCSDLGARSTIHYRVAEFRCPLPIMANCVHTFLLITPSFKTSSSSPRKFPSELDEQNLPADTGKGHLPAIHLANILESTGQGRLWRVRRACKQKGFVN